MGLRERLDRLRERMRPPRRAIPTRAGLFALGAPIILGIAAVNASNNLLFMVLGGVLGAIVLSGVFSERNVRGIHVDVRPVSPAHAGEPARLRVSFSRELPLPRSPAYSLRVVERTSRSLLASLSRRAKPGLLDVTLPILEGAEASRLGSRTFQTRGRARLGHCELATRYPFGLLEKLRDIEVDADVVVRPRRIAVPAALADPRGLASDGDASERRGLGLDVYGLREREERDAWHRVHALRSLSLGREVVIETSGLERPTAWLGVANLDRADRDAFERALEVAQAVVREWHERGYAVGMITARETWRPEDASAAALLDGLALLETAPRIERDGRAALWIVPAGANAPRGAAAVARVTADGRVELSRAQEAA